MRLLPDTHVFLWWIAGDPALPAEIRDMLNGEPDVFLSAMVVWELLIKQSTGKLVAPTNLAERARDAGFLDLPITATHAAETGRLPLIHRDPFDRILIAQARCEQLTIATHDRMIQKYDVPVLSV